MSDGNIIEELVRLMALPEVWYADSPFQEYGRVLKLPASDYGPELYVFNDKQFQEIKDDCLVRWRHIREYRGDWRKLDTVTMKEFNNAW